MNVDREGTINRLCHVLDFCSAGCYEQVAWQKEAGHAYMHGCKLDRLGFSYIGLVSCAFLTVLCLLFQRRITECVYDDQT